MAAPNKRIYDRFSPPVQQAVVYAQAASVNAGVDCIYPESFAVAILNTGRNEVTANLIEEDIDLEKCLGKLKKDLVAKAVNNEVKGVPNYENLKLSKQVIEICKIADKLRQDVVKSEHIEIRHIFIAILESSKAIRQIFKGEGLDVGDFIEVLKSAGELASHADVPTSNGKQDKTPALKSFCIDVTEQAKNGKLDPIIAREKEIESAITILCRRGKNNPIFLGDAGVGKTAIVEGIAQRINSGTVPKQLLGYKLYSLSLTSLVAGTKYRGEFEERMHNLVKEIQNAKNCILFIDEIHMLIGAGSASGNALDASNILKPFLARNDLRCIGATTLDEFKKHFSKDAALVRRFQQIIVDEPTNDQARQIMDGIKSKYEDFHGCIISNDAIEMMIRLCDRYLPEKKFPDKAIDCMDICCAKFAWTNNKKEKPVVTSVEVAKVISEQCQIPYEVIMWDENERIQKIEKVLSDRVIGQPNAVETVCRILKNSYSGVRNPHKPIGSFVFGGESGTGKTHMAKQLADAVFGKESALVRLDMTEYSEAHSVSKLVGSPPGYVGFQDADVFVDKISRKPYCIVLLDEMEKAHPDVMKLFLQVMSDGIMTDANGNKINFKNVILIMTGNFGMNAVSKKSMGFHDTQDTNLVEKEQRRLIEYCQETYGVEFVNRVDEFIPFVPLDKESLKKISSIHLCEISSRLTGRKCKLVFTEEVFEYLAKISTKEHGKNANILKRLIAKKIEPCISDALLSMDNKEHIITIDVKDDKVVYRKSKSGDKEGL